MPRYRIRITLERSAYRSWLGQMVPESTIVKTFEDEREATDWFINHSYFEERFTHKATWERLDVT